ncbi:MAG: hypothetical protein QXO72_05345 [Sulfolobales archaeon]
MVNDYTDIIEEVVEFASSINSYIIYDKLNIKPIMSYNMRMKWSLNINLNEVINLSMDNTYLRKISDLVNDVCRKYKVRCIPAFNTTT